VLNATKCNINRWILFIYDPDWLINSLMQTVACLPRLTKLEVRDYICEVRIPLGHFANLSKLSVSSIPFNHVAFFISQMSTVIANSPQLKSLDVMTKGSSFNNAPLEPLLTLNDLFAKTSTKTPLCLEHLSLNFMDATVNQETLPHLMHLSSFWFQAPHGGHSVAQSVWTSFLVHNIKLSDVEISGIITEETMLYLSSFSGLKRLVVGAVVVHPDVIMKNLENMLFTAVLPKHVNSLQTLKITGDGEKQWVERPIILPVLLSS
jgi:hypothetical protein